MEALRRTALFELHRRLGARMTAFGGFEMPVSYAGIIDEHLAVRSRAGVFDLGHMGEFELTGAAAIALLERAMTNSAARLEPGRAQYTLMCTPDGGTIDDLIVYRLDDARFMLCVNASNIAVDREWLLGLGAHQAGFRDVSEETGLIAVQGPRAEAILQSLSRASFAGMRRFAVSEAEVAGLKMRRRAHRLYRRGRLRAFHLGRRRREALQRNPRSRRAAWGGALRTGRA